MKSATVSTLRVRAAQVSDAAAIADLSTQLGYPATPDEIKSRIAALLGDPNHALLVAAGDQVIGWAHVAVVRGITADAQAELLGLIVDRAYRGCGTGGVLLREAESWARARNLPVLSVRSNIIRDQAHRFYQQRGYKLVKTQHAFVKRLTV